MTATETSSSSFHRKPASAASTSLATTELPSSGCHDGAPASTMPNTDEQASALSALFPQHPTTRRTVHHRLLALLCQWIASDCRSLTDRYPSRIPDAIRASIQPTDATQADLARDILAELHPAAMIRLLSPAIDAERDVLLLHARCDAEPMTREAALDVLSGMSDAHVVHERVQARCTALLGPGLALLGIDPGADLHDDIDRAIIGNEASFVAALRQGSRDTAIRILASHAKIEQARVAEAVWTRDTRSLIGLAWRSGYSMRAAMLLQTQLAGIPRKSAMGSTDDGVSPMGRGEMAWQLAVLVGS